MKRFNPEKEITPEQASFLKANCQKMDIASMAKHLSVSVSKVQAWQKELNLIGKRFKGEKPVIEKHEYYFDWSTTKTTDFIFHNV